MPRARGTLKTGGRSAGTPNKNPAWLKEVAQTYTSQALIILSKIMNGEKYPAQARAAAAGMLLDRGWGKAHQSISADVTAENRFVVHMPEPLDDAEWKEFLEYKRGEKPLETAPLKFAGMLKSGPEWDKFKQQQAKLIEAKPNGKSALPINQTRPDKA